MLHNKTIIPRRVSIQDPLSSIFISIFGALAILSFFTTGISPESLVKGIPDMFDIISGMFPPDFSSPQIIFRCLLETFQVAFAGTALGVVISLPVAVFASKSLSPHPIFFQSARFMVSLFRTIPDLVWALIFVASVGLGSFSGVLTIMVDTIGFCGKFFADSIEDADSGAVKALHVIGASRTGTLFSAVIPESIPGMITSALFSLEKAIRASVVLGLVGAGGIGIELKKSFDMFEYDRASALLISIFVFVILVERLSIMIRRRIQ